MDDPERLVPRLFPSGGGMRRFVTDPGLEYRTGHTKLSRGQGMSTFFWYDEFWVVRQGSGRLTVTDRVSGESQTAQLGPRDTVFFAKGVHVTSEATSDEPLVFFYIAIPASNKEAPWLARMTAEDIEDVRKRDEYA